MTAKKSPSLTILLIVLQLFVNNLLFAQNETKQKNENMKLNMPNNFSYPTGIIPPLQMFEFDTTYNKTVMSSLYFQNIFSENDKVNSNFSFDYKKDREHFRGLGGYEHFTFHLSYRPINKISINSEIGLLKQSSYLNPFESDFRYSLKSSIEYEITNGFILYLYGLFVSPPVIDREFQIDPFADKISLFPQSEIGGGIKKQFKNFKTDIGVYTSNYSLFIEDYKINTINTKVSIEF